VTGIQARLTERRGAFTHSEIRVAEWVEGNFEMVAFQTVNEMARATNVSEATIVRFARKLGYDSFSAMQRDVQEGLQQQFSLGDRLQRALDGDEGPLGRAYRRDLDNLRRTYERLEEGDFAAAVRAIAHARRVGVVGLRASAGSATYLAFALQLVRPRVAAIRHDLDHVHEQLLDFEPGDTIVAVSLFKPARRTLEVVREARDRCGATVVAITNSRVSAVGRLADVVIPVAGEGTFNSYAAVASISGALLDGVATALRDSATLRLRRIDEINRADDVYVA
jgi:DNA-binding MurR/RpiR family transcriptional regulator